MALSMRIASTPSATRGFLGKRVTSISNGCRVTMKAGNWMPGTPQPEWLPEDLPGTFGFDPLGLGKDKASLVRFQEAEVYHCRWAMLGIAGSLGVEVLGFGNWYDAQSWAFNGGKPTYFGAELPLDFTAVALFMTVAFAIAEGYRGGQTATYPERIYPGGAFDPLGMGKDASKLSELKLKEIKNGRLAMVAFAGILGQHAATGKSPLEALADHVANPWAVNFATNGVSVPGL